MATTFVGIELGGERHRSRHAAVVLQRRRNTVELRHWSCLLGSDEELLEYLSAMAGTSGVIAVHGNANDAAAILLRRVWRVLDYRMLFALAPRHRTRALVRVEPPEIQRAFSANPDHPAPGVLERMGGLTPAVDYRPLTQCLTRLPLSGTLHHQFEATTRAALSSYAALWCWWHGPAG